MDDSLYDKRVMDRNLEKGLIQPKELEKHLKSLPDLTDQVMPQDDSDDDNEE